MNESLKSKGGLWANRNKKADNHPDWTGHVVITGEQIKKLVEAGKATGEAPKLQVAAWSRVSEGGKQYFFLKTDAYFKERKPEPPKEDFSDNVPF